ncbi:MAG TPA: PHB depolymerase family esterase [Acidimicrobiia bacterium]|nr:PHB depolymerase family esterase [Acidimicrobiia bacterium]
MVRRFGVLMGMLAALAAAGAISPVAAAALPPAAGRVEERVFTNAAGTRRYRLYVPSAGATGRPLMVWLHGCGKPGPMEAGHGLARVAEERGFVLAFPLQDRAANAENCWNWFADTDRHRGRGEASIIAGLTTDLIGQLHLDPRRVYAGGYSAGGAMTSVMGATYPDLYAAIAPCSGAPYGLDPTGAAAFAEMGERARPLPAFILQGVADEISVYPLGRANLGQWLATDDLADDGHDNGSVSRVPSAATPEAPGPGSPLPLVTETYTGRDGTELAAFVTSPAEHLVDAMLLYDDIGLGVQGRMMDFLLAHRGPAPGPRP